MPGNIKSSGIALRAAEKERTGEGYLSLCVAKVRALGSSAVALMASHSSFESLCDSTSQWAFVSCGANEPSLTNSLNSDPVEDFRLNAWEKRSLNCHYVVINQLPHNQWTFKFQVSDPNLGMSPESSGGQCEPYSITHTSPSLR